MQNIQQQITQNFQDNIEYFSQNHPDIYEKIAAFDSAVEQGAYTPRYELTYEDGGFDLFEKATQKYFYAKQSLQYSKLAQQSVDTSIEENCFVAFVKHKEFTKKSDTPFMFADDGLTPIAKLTQQEEVKKFDKYIFFGLGLGVHLEAIVQKIEPKICFLVEQDLELFRNSLLTTNYKELAKKTELVFSVFDDNFSQSVHQFLEYKYHYNHYIKYFLMGNQDQKIVEDFYLTLSKEAYFYYMYNDLLKHIVKPFDSFAYGANILLNSLKLDNSRPYLLLGAGPSLQKNVQWLQENSAFFEVVALSATLGFLERHNIKADIIVHVDSFEVATSHFDAIENKSFFSDALFCFAATTPLKIQKLFPKQSVFLFENGTSYIANSLKLSAVCSGSTAYQFLLRADAKDIYLLGLDLAIDSKTKQTHIDTHSYNRTIKESEDFNYKNTLIEVEGNKTSKVLTTPHFQTSIESVNLSTKLFKKEQNIYNLGDGAAFDGVMAKDIKNVVFQNKQQTHNKTLFQNSSTNMLEKKELLEKVEFYKELQRKIEHFANLEFNNYQDFLEALEQFYPYFIQEQFLQKYELCKVFDLYFHKSLVFLFQTDNSDVKEIQNFFTTHLQQMIDFYNTKATDATN